MRVAYARRKRARTSAGSAVVAATAQRSVAFVSVLFTFCPPGPELRAYENSSSCSGIGNGNGTSAMAARV
jgi:hypothetical protein